MFTVIAGCGRLGAGLAKVLSGQGHDVVVVAEEIDRNRLGNGFDGITVSGNPTDGDVLQKAGIGTAELFVAATSDDSTNVMAIQVAKEVFHVPTVLARISDPDRERFYRSLGLNTVCPTTTGIKQILDLIRGSAM
jgi:trk system potassium uptake protein